MTFAAYGRWARCRAAHLSLWSRKLNMNLQLHRGLASSPLLKLAAEQRPLSGFAEQRSSTMGGTAVQLRFGEDLDDANGNTAAQAIAAILKDLTELDVAICNSFTEMLDLSVFGVSSSCCGLKTKYHPD